MNESNAMALADNAMGAVDWDALHERSRAIFDAVHRGSSLALQSGLYGTAPKATLGALMTDPNERAAYRQAGRQVGPPERGTDADIAHAAMMVAPAPMRAIMSAPKIATAGLAAYGYLSGTDAAGGAEDQNAVKTLQTQLRDAGLYRGEIDGKMGPATQRAQQDFMAAEQTRQTAELKSRELATAEGANTATLETARANQKTADAKLAADKLAAEELERKAERQRLGDERMRELDKNLSPMSRVIRDYSGPAGLVAGTVLGAGARYATQKASNAFTRETAAAGDAIMAKDVAAGKKGIDAVMSRAARTDQFWRQGGAKEVPFQLTPGTAPGFAVNPRATPLASTYNPNVHPAVEAAAIAPAVIEEEVSRHYKSEWEGKLAEAEKAVSEDASEVNIQRLNTAKDNVALFTGLQRIGMSSGMVQGVGAVGARFMKKGVDMQPNMMAAEQEQMAIQKWLRDAAERAAKKANAGKPKSVLEQRAIELGSGPPPPALVGSAAWKARQQ